MTQAKPKHGDLKIWWIPQIPGKPFEVPVANLVEARLLYDTLAAYDAFQLANRIRGDYSNVGGLMWFDSHDDQDGPDGSWCEWEDHEGNGIGWWDDLDELRRMASQGGLPACCYE